MASFSSRGTEASPALLVGVPGGGGGETGERQLRLHSVGRDNVGLSAYRT